jgi:hypothetical protein
MIRPIEIPLGAHLVTPRFGYEHHGIYVGDGRVVHYAGLSRTLRGGPVQEVSLEAFLGGRAMRIQSHANVRFTSAVVVERARSRVGEDRYRVATNNCEHFCSWCLSGQNRSEQVERILRFPRAALRVAWRFAGGVMPSGAGMRTAYA